MSLHIESIGAIPEQTVRVAKAAFPKDDNLYIKMRDELGSIYQDEMFASLFASRGQPAMAPWRLALITIMQFVEALTDRAAANAVRSRIDWKYALGLELDNPGFDFSILSEFRARLVTGQAQPLLFEQMLNLFKQRGWIKERGQMRTDSTHVLGAVRTLNRVGTVHETLRHALNTLATVAPQWLSEQVSADWYARYSSHLESFGLAKKQSDQQQLAQIIGQDGHYLLEIIYRPTAPSWLKQIEAVQVLRQVWVQQYLHEEEQLRFREESEAPPASLEIVSPHDVAVRAGTKRHTQWMGYKVHLTETCEDDTPHLLTQLETTPATQTDGAALEAIQQGLAQKELRPAQQLVDAGYTDAENLVNSQHKHSIDLLGPLANDVSWQAQAAKGYAASDFEIDWDQQKAICPEGKSSQRWWSSYDRHGKHVTKVGFARSDCEKCVNRSLCSRDTKVGRIVTLRSNREQYQALQTARERQKGAEFKAQYRKRAGIEGSISQAVNRFEIRQARYRGIGKVGLEHLLIGAAINLVRAVAWIFELPRVTKHTSRFGALAPAS